MSDIIYGIAVAVMAVTFIYRVCERMVEAMQELEEEHAKAKDEGSDGDD